MKVVTIGVEELEELIEKKLSPIRNSLANLIEIKTYTTSEAAVLIGKSKTTVYRYCVKGMIKATPNGKGFLITHQALLDFLNPTATL